jgi:hypothetical protein
MDVVKKTLANKTKLGRVFEYTILEKEASGVVQMVREVMSERPHGGASL